MNWAGLINPARIRVKVVVENRREAIAMLSALIAEDTGAAVEALNEALSAREKLGSTAIGNGVALPHATSEAVSEPVAAMLVLEEPLACSTPDDVPVSVFIGFLAPSGGRDLGTLAHIVKRLRDDGVLRALRSARTPQEAHAALDGAAPAGGGR